MRIAILAKEESPTVLNELAPALRNRGFTCDIIIFSTLDITNVGEDARIQSLLAYDVIYYRTALGEVGATLLRDYFLSHSKRVLNLGPGTHPYNEHKKYQCATVSGAGILVPKTVLDTTDVFSKVARALGTPFVAKGDVSSQGRDVHLIHTEADFSEVSCERDACGYFYQEYIPHEHDYRVHLVGGRAVAAYRRVPVSGEFRTNVHCGAGMHPVPDAEQPALFAHAENINTCFGLDICAVDLLPHRDTGELYFAEINSNPGWEVGDQSATGVNMSEIVANFIASLAWYDPKVQ